MQPHRHFNELDHWRNTSQRPQPSLSADLKQTKPEKDKKNNGKNRSHSRIASHDSTRDLQNAYNTQTHSHHYHNNNPQNAFGIEASRGWLENAPVPSLSQSSEMKHATTTPSASSSSKTRDKAPLTDRSELPPEKRGLLIIIVY
ncbi:hypothetical protein BCR43DRAFT_366372 [Syncephalastrum racemosum]|uniref:Uncharacterized protein n=1 Tax=Syncephalastrum racemosum TaxID=13706 RepID=A0A1X2H412_SYNRA|nr:hypothetical protein BCR43DRAFT_366372 [Syncephalastrum racemosum]